MLFLVAICCCLAESGHVILDPNKTEEQVISFPGLNCNVLVVFTFMHLSKPVQNDLCESLFVL